jgi:2-oxoisovalerate dehydrogenase E1 component
VVIESRAAYQTRGTVQITVEPEPVGRAKLLRSGTDALLVSWGPMVKNCLDVADSLQAEGVNIGVLDLRWLAPLDERALEMAAKQADGRVVIVHEAVKTGGFGAELVARLHELLGESPAPRVRRVATPDVRMPAAPVLQRALIPDLSMIRQAVLEVTSRR